MTESKKLKLLALTILACFVTTSWHSAWGNPQKIIPYQMSFIRPAEEKIKARSVNLATNLKFKSGASTLELSHDGNSSELYKIDSLMTTIINDPSITLNEISIIGYSSPEGTFEHNELLAKERAMSVKKYLAARYNSIAENKYNVSFGGENWNDLYEMVLNSETPEKTDVLRIIKEVDIMKGREKQLMLLAGGIPYNYILTNFFPILRKVDLNFSYNIRNFDTTEAAEIYQINPKILSLSEIFDVASNYPKESEPFGSMMVSSAKLYPNNDIANINAAAASIIGGDGAAATDYLAKVNETFSGDYYNVLGVNQALSNDIDNAITSLEKAIEQKSSDAEQNLVLIKKHLTTNDILRDTIFIKDTVYLNVARQITKKELNPSQWALKTNLIYWAALQPNIEAEFYFANRWSVNLEYQVAWWSRPSKHQYYQYMHLGIEGRYWFKRDGSFSGHHLGVYAGGGYYDLSLGRQSNNYEGYQGEFAIAAGLSYGYAWKLNRSLWMEAGIGFGNIMTEYRRYDYQDTHYCYQSTERVQFLGPTKLRLSLVWRPQSKSKSKK